MNCAVVLLNVKLDHILEGDYSRVTRLCGHPVPFNPDYSVRTFPFLQNFQRMYCL